MAVDGIDEHYWYLELRRLELKELPTVGYLQDARIAQTIGFIDTHYYQAPSLQDMADVAGLSMFHFARCFTKLVGVSPKQYLLSRQLQVARWLLRTTVLSVSEVSTRAGFATHGHFSNTFSRVLGQTPSAYRDRMAMQKHIQVQ